MRDHPLAKGYQATPFPERPVQRGHGGGGAKSGPEFASDRAMSAKHHANSVHYNLQHAGDHLRAAHERMKQMRSRGIEAPVSISRVLRRWLSTVGEEPPVRAEERRRKKD